VSGGAVSPAKTTGPIESPRPRELTKNKLISAGIGKSTANRCKTGASGGRRMNEVNARRARLVPGWVTVFGAGIPSRNVTSQLGQLSLASLRGRLIEYQLRLG